MKDYIFILVSVASGVMVISSYQPVHSVLWLVLSFLSVAGLFLLHDLDFLGLILVIVYVGALATLFLFVVMMLELSRSPILRETSFNFIPLVVLVSLVFLTEFLTFRGHLQTPLWVSSSNLSVYGVLLYVDIQFLFLLLALLLLAAMVGALLVVGSFPSGTKLQSMYSQIRRSSK